MLGNIRNFSKTIFAKILLVIIVIPFVFWGMGSAFNSGNTNSIAKINKYNISTQDFIDYINNSKINNQIIRDNIDNNALEELLSQLISSKILELEIEKLDLYISESSLIDKIKKTKKFIGEDGKFSRIKYEKFLLSQNYSAPEFEEMLKNNELRNKLFNYISGGFASPYFLVNNTFKDEKKEIEINFINLNDSYKKKDEFSNEDINLYIKENNEILKKDYIDFEYAIIKPKDIVGIEEFNDEFFQKIDELENNISNGLSMDDLIGNIDINRIRKENFLIDAKTNNIEKKIYEKRNENKIQLIDENEFYVIYEIKKLKKELPKVDKIFKNDIAKILHEQEKYEFNKNLIKEINTNNFNQSKFDKISKNKEEIIRLISIDDNKKFTNDSINLLYSLPLNSFTLIADNQNDVYLAKIIRIIKKNIEKNSSDFNKYNLKTINDLQVKTYSSFDNFLNKKYKIKVNENTLERVKNYFR
jgi:peptidyl-prolyl cis-trans isomerase D